MKICVVCVFYLFRAFAKTHASFIKEFIELSNGIPSHGTFNRIFSSLDRDLLRQRQSGHGKGIMDILAEKQICLDGKN